MAKQKGEAEKGGLAQFRNWESKLCPLVKLVLPECYCANTDSGSNEAAIRLCSGEFEKCEIFKKRSLETLPAS